MSYIFKKGRICVGMIEINNYLIMDLPKAFTEDVLTQYHYSIIPKAYENCEKLHKIGIETVCDFIEQVNTVGEGGLALASDIEPSYISVLHHQIQSVLYRPIKMNKLIDNETYLNALSMQKIKNTQDLILECNNSTKAIELEKKTQIPYENLVRLAKIADLSRLPGVKEVRSIVYYDSGLNCIKTLANMTPVQAKAMVADYLKKIQSKRVPPQLKEITCQVKWAEISPILIHFDE